MEYIGTLLTSLGSCTLVGFLFWNWINSKFGSYAERDKENRARIRDLEEEIREFVLKDEHHEMRKEDREGIERQLSEMRKDIKDMPEKILTMIKQFVK